MEDLAFEKHFTVFELAEIWGVSHMTVRRWIEGESDVLTFGSDESRYGRKRKTYRIPKSVAARIYQKRCTR